MFLMTLDGKIFLFWHFCNDLFSWTAINRFTSGTPKKGTNVERRIVGGKKDLKYFHRNFCVLWPFLDFFSRFTRFSEKIFNECIPLSQLNVVYARFCFMLWSRLSWWSMFMLPPPKKLYETHLDVECRIVSRSLLIKVVAGTLSVNLSRL